MDGVSKCMCMVFDCENITFKRTVNMFECIYIAEIVYEGVVEPYENKNPEQLINVLVTAGKLEKKPPHQKLTPIWVNMLTRESKGT